MARTDASPECPAPSDRVDETENKKSDESAEDSAQRSFFSGQDSESTASVDDSVQENVVYRDKDGMTYDENGLPVKVENKDCVTIKEDED